MPLYYVTKYALSGKIMRKELQAENEFQGYAYDRTNGAFGSYKIGHDCFQGWDAALENAERRRTAKVASLNKQLVALQKKKWTAP